MKNRFISFVCVCACVCLAGCGRSVAIRRITHVSHDAGRVPVIIRPPDAAGLKVTLPASEKLTYDIRWLGLSVGELSLSVLGTDTVSGRDVFVLEALITTTSFLSKIYPVKARYVSYMDVRQLHALRHEVYHRGSEYEKDSVTDFDQKTHQATFTDVRDQSAKIYGVPPGAHDLLTAFYHVCLVPLALDDRIEYFVFNDAKNYRLTHHISAKASLRMSVFGDKEQEAFVMNTETSHLDGGRVKKASVTSYLSLDPRHILLYAEMQGPLLTRITVHLTEKEPIY